MWRQCPLKLPAVVQCHIIIFSKWPWLILLLTEQELVCLEEAETGQLAVSISEPAAIVSADMHIVLNHIQANQIFVLCKSFKMLTLQPVPRSNGLALVQLFLLQTIFP